MLAGGDRKTAKNGMKVLCGFPDGASMLCVSQRAGQSHRAGCYAFYM